MTFATSACATRASSAASLCASVADALHLEVQLLRLSRADRCEDAVTDLKEFSFHFHDALPRVRRALLLLHAGDDAPGCSSTLDGILSRGLFTQTSKAPLTCGNVFAVSRTFSVTLGQRDVTALDHKSLRAQHGARDQEDKGSVRSGDGVVSCEMDMVRLCVHGVSCLFSDAS